MYMRIENQFGLFSSTILFNKTNVENVKKSQWQHFINLVHVLRKPIQNGACKYND